MSVREVFRTSEVSVHVFDGADAADGRPIVLYALRGCSSVELTPEEAIGLAQVLLAYAGRTPAH